ALAAYRWAEGQLTSNNRGMLEALNALFRILLSEKDLEARAGSEAVRIAQMRLRQLGRDFAYLGRTTGRHVESRRLLVDLIRDTPFAPELYVDLAKTALQARFGLHAAGRTPR